MVIPVRKTIHNPIKSGVRRQIDIQKVLSSHSWPGRGLFGNEIGMFFTKSSLPVSKY